MQNRTSILQRYTYTLCVSRYHSPLKPNKSMMIRTFKIPISVHHRHPYVPALTFAAPFPPCPVPVRVCVCMCTIVLKNTLPHAPKTNQHFVPDDLLIIIRLGICDHNIHTTIQCQTNTSLTCTNPPPLNHTLRCPCTILCVRVCVFVYVMYTGTRYFTCLRGSRIRYHETPAP